MRLTVEKDPESIKRYRHIKPARGWRALACAARCPGTARTCTLHKGHRGPHVAHGMFKKVLAVWDANAEVRGSVERLRATVQTRARSGVRSRRPTAALGALWRGVVRIGDSIGDLALLVLFLAMVGFAIHWLSVIMR